MKATGIVRRIDDLGRVVIPKEIRRACHLREGDPLEIFVDHTGRQPTICLCKYETGFLESLTALADTIDDEMMNSVADGQRNEVRRHFNEIARLLKEWEEGE